MINIDTNQNVAVESVEETTSQTSSPQVEVPTTEEQTAPIQADQPVEEQVADVQTDEPNDPREYQIKRLAEENRRLKSENKGNAFDAMRPQGQQQVDIRNYTDEFGNVNYAGYNQAVNSQIQTVATQTVRELQDEQNARAKHPELFADPDIEQEIADVWLASKLRGVDTPISDIAARFSKRLSKDVSKAEKKAVEKVLQEVSVKEQAGLAAPGQTSQGARQVQSEEDLEQLSQATRHGNDDAIVARMSKIPWANK